MNPPVSNFFDCDNAAALCRASAAAYGEDGLAESRDAGDFHRSDTPTLRLGSGSDIHALLLEGETDLVIAFRGTADWRNWLTDLNCRKVPLVWADGKVHRGFCLALESLAEQLDAAV